MMTEGDSGAVLVTRKAALWSAATFAVLFVCCLAQCVRLARARDLAEARATRLELDTRCPPEPATAEERAARRQRDMMRLLYDKADAGNLFVGDSPPWYGVETTPSLVRPGLP